MTQGDLGGDDKMMMMMKGQRKATLPPVVMPTGHIHGHVRMSMDVSHVTAL
jgi:hypothetical protein